MLKEFWADLLDPKDPLMAIRQKGWDLFEKIGLPKAKQEPFQYLSKKLEIPPPAKELAHTFTPQEGLVFIDGFFDLALSQIPAPLVCQSLTQAIKSYGLFLQNRLGKLFLNEADPFAALNGAFHGRGAFLYVPPKCKAALHLTHIHTCSQMASPRLHIYLGRNAELTLTQTSEGKSSFSNAAFDFVLDEGASLKWVDRAEGDFQATRALVKKNAKLKAVFLGKKLRHSINVQLTEENSEVELLGLSQLEQDEQGHIHAHVEHMAPHTRSRQHFKSVVKDQSRFSFEGKIKVLPIAQKTESYQLNNNLILSDEAQANAKPNLEIFADDVKASHGATFGRLNDEELFYLRSRGLSLEDARGWLINGFCKEILDHAR